MRFKFFFLFVMLLLLVSCEKPECESDADCTRPHFSGSCVEGKCVYAPIPGECGNGICEDSETKCSCPEDCGVCAGSSGPFELVCVNDQCIEGIAEAKVKPVISTDELSAGGDKLRLTTEYNQPFNMAKDLFNVRISLISENPRNEERKIAKLSLVGQTPDRQTVPLAEKVIERPLWPGFPVDAGLIVDFPASEKAGTISSMELQVTYEYLTGTTTKTPKSIVVENRYSGVKFDWVMPGMPYPCPKSCDDDNPGTLDVCDASTDFFCEHRPIPDACGNYVCDADENPCICPVDCGPCSNGGTYTGFACVEKECVAQVKPGVSQAAQSLFDDRNLGPFHLQNNYEYVDPFIAADDRIKLVFSLYDKDAGVSDIKITSVRLFEGTNELASAEPNLALPDAGSSGVVEINVPLQEAPETGKTVSVKVWYEYKKDDSVKKGSYTKTFGKITFLSPGLRK